MANVSFTPANVKAAKYSGGISYDYAGATIATAGQACFRDAADQNEAKLSDNNGTGTRSFDGFSMHPAADGQPIHLFSGGPLEFGAGVFVPATVYALSDTPGAICPIADVTGVSGRDPVVVGQALTDAILLVVEIDPDVTQ